MNPSTTRIESPPKAAFIAALVFLLMSVAGATVVLAVQDWFGAGDLRAMVLWSTFGATLVFGAVRALGTRSVRWSATKASVVHGVGGLVFGVGWLRLVMGVLGPWILAFSFPVGTIWVIAALVGFGSAALVAHPRRWRLAVVTTLVPIVLWVVGVRLATATPSDIVVTLKVGVSHEQRESVWDDVLGRPSARGSGHDLLPDIQSVSAFDTDDRCRYRVSFQPGTRKKRRDEIVQEVERSPLVDRVQDYEPALHGTVDLDR